VTSFAELMAARRMTRAFTSEPVPADLLDGILRSALRAPSAGNTQGVDLLVLHGADETARYWDVTLPAPRRESFRWQGLLEAPVLVVVYADAAAYVARYGSPDKAASGLGDGARHWPVPYWTVDAGFAAMALQLAAIDAGLGVLFFGLFDNAPAVAAAFGVPPDRQAIGAVAMGWPDRGRDEPGRSARRPRRPLDEVVHRGRW
jgi:nitroreductase